MADFVLLIGDMVSFLDNHDGALMVLITLVYVVATCFICWANIKSAKAAREQLTETQRQYEEDNRPDVTYEIFFENREFYGLRFTNYGKKVAKNIRISLEKKFVDSIAKTYADFLREFDGKEFMLGVGQSYSIYFGKSEFRNNPNKQPIKGNLTYSDGNVQYSEEINVDFSIYPTFFSTTSHEEKLLDQLKQQNAELARLREAVVNSGIPKENEKNA